MDKIVKLMTGTSIFKGEELVKGNYPDISSWSDNLETAAHYYEGKIIEIEVRLDEEKSGIYISELSDLSYYNLKLKDYTYGFTEMECPKGAIWYSFSSKYLQDNVISIQEIFPDMSEFNEE